MKRILICTLIIFAISCNSARPKEVEKREKREYEIVNITRGKHIYISLKDVQTGKIYTHVYVSKHCSACDNYQIGQRLTLTRAYWTEGGADISDFENLHLELEK